MTHASNFLVSECFYEFYLLFEASEFIMNLLQPWCLMNLQFYSNKTVDAVRKNNHFSPQ